MFEPYRPRRPTAAEKEHEKDQRELKRQRQVDKLEREKEYRGKRSSKLTFSELSGVGYQDFTLGPSGPIKTRTQLDERVYSDYRSRVVTKDRPLLPSVPSLSDCCLDIIADNYGEPSQLVMLDSIHHRAHVHSLFDRVRRIRNDEESLLPFEFWLNFALEFGLDLPDRYKTYRGLVVSSDQAELDAIREYNQEAVNNLVRQPEFVPPFFLATLDLSNDKSFTDSDVYKLRNPLASFLSVLKLDNTSITDGGIAWISRAASDSEDYKHLEVLSLKDLNRVTNNGVAKLSRLSNLRMLGQSFRLFKSRQPQLTELACELFSPDLRRTGCTPNVLSELNRTGIRPSFAPPRPRRDLAQTLVEFQLFGGSYSSSRILSLLHRLARIHHAPIVSLQSIIRSPLTKQLTIHLSSMDRRPAQSNLNSTGRQKTTEELYNEQLALSNFSGSALATHHSAFGTLTSTKSLARKLVQDDGRAIGDKGAAFRTGAGDSVALGEWVGQGRIGGRASLYDLGTRKQAAEPKRNREREPFSDTEDEEEKEKLLREHEAEALRIWEEQISTGFSFYAGRKPIPKPERVIVAAEQSRLTLLRHIPYVPPYERQGAAATPLEKHKEENGTDSMPRSTSRPRTLTEGTTLLKKKRRVDPHPGSTTRPISSSSSPATTSSSIRASHHLSSNTRPPQLSPSPSNPFHRKPNSTSTSARTDSKNLVKFGPSLAKRSSLSAFKR
ncbi:hypothetical protein JCM3765_006393 [Sporobolomyces pararoseus]